jgi:hypothetical protein
MSNDDRPLRVANIDAAAVQTINQTHPMKHFREGANKLEQTALLAPPLTLHFADLTCPHPQTKLAPANKFQSDSLKKNSYL